MSEAIARRVAAVVGASGLSSAYLAQVTGVDRSVILALLAGRALPLWSQLQAVAEALPGDHVEQLARLVRRAGDPYCRPDLTGYLAPLTSAKVLDVFGPAGINRPECFICSQMGAGYALKSGEVRIYCGEHALFIDGRRQTPVAPDSAKGAGATGYS